MKAKQQNKPVPSQIVDKEEKRKAIEGAIGQIEKNYGIQTNHEAVIVSPVSGAHNGPWLAGYGLLFLRREDESLEDTQA